MSNKSKQRHNEHTRIKQPKKRKRYFSASNESAGWYAVSGDGINMITFIEGKFTFTMKGDVNKFYTEKGFAKRISQLIKRGY